MKNSMERIFYYVRLLARLCWPAAAFIVVCTVIFLFIFTPILQLVGSLARGFIPELWLSFLLAYIILGIAFTRFVARQFHASFGAEEWRVQRRMIFLSGLPFYVLSVLLLALGISILLDPSTHSIEMIGGVLFFSLAGGVLFALVSAGYVLLLRFFLRRPVVARQ